jgi:hypothetical protein
MQLDVRAPRFAAAVTTLVIVAILITGSGWLALAQTVVFALGAISSRLSPYSALFRVAVRPRLGPAREFEPAEPVRFAQGLGLAFLTVATIALFTGATAVGFIAAALALVAAFLNAAFGLCLGCEAYLLIRRLTSRAEAA